MECPNCKEKYEFYEVPFEYRNMKFLVTEFLCPFCEVWITPSKSYKNLLTMVFILATISIIFIVLGVYYDPLYKLFAFASGLITFITFILSYKILSYVIK